MKRIIIFISLIFCTLNANSQIHEIGVFGGASNFIGDIGSTAYFSPNEPVIGILYKWNRSTRHAFRFSYIQGAIKGQDSYSKAENRKLRGYTFENNIKEFSAGLEFNFLDFDLHEGQDKLFTPYMFMGVNYVMYDELYIEAKKSKKDGKSSTFALPIILGMKTLLTKNLIVAGEIGARFTFTDNLDGSNPKNSNFESLKFGNLNSKDWYVFTGITVTYTFGQNPCFCAN